MFGTMSTRHGAACALMLCLMHGAACAGELGGAVAGIVGKHAYPPFPPEEVAAIASADDGIAPGSPDGAAAVLTALLERRDRYASVVSFDGSASAPAGKAGVGMDIVAGRGGCIVCIPNPGSPAEKAGIRIGDILAGADGISFVPSAPRRPPGQDASSREYASGLLFRAAAVLRGGEGEGVVLRIVRGLPPECTPEELSRALEKAPAALVPPASSGTEGLRTRRDGSHSEDAAEGLRPAGGDSGAVGPGGKHSAAASPSSGSRAAQHAAAPSEAVSSACGSSLEPSLPAPPSAGFRGKAPASTVFDVRAVRREASYPTAVRTDSAAPLPCIRITRFGSETGREVAALLRDIPSGMPVAIDLRGNTGGSVKAMLEVLRRFLPAGAVMVRSRSREGEKTLRNTRRGSHAGVTAYLWQDGLTASAAEVFIASMRCGGSVLSIGVRSAGKSCAQQWFRAGRHRVKVTTEELLLPGEDFGWQDSGLAPDMPLAPGEEYRAAVLQAAGLAQKP